MMSVFGRGVAEKPPSASPAAPSFATTCITVEPIGGRDVTVNETPSICNGWSYDALACLRRGVAMTEGGPNDKEIEYAVALSAVAIFFISSTNGIFAAGRGRRPLRSAASFATAFAVRNVN